MSFTGSATGCKLKVDTEFISHCEYCDSKISFTMSAIRAERGIGSEDFKRINLLVTCVSCGFDTTCLTDNLNEEQECIITALVSAYSDEIARNENAIKQRKIMQYGVHVGALGDRAIAEAKRVKEALDRIILD